LGKLCYLSAAEAGVVKPPLDLYSNAARQILLAEDNPGDASPIGERLARSREGGVIGFSLPGALRMWIAK
jgi:hypothetical protein